MQIIFNQEAAEQLKKTHTVLELEVFENDGKLYPTYCVVPPEKINLLEFPYLENYKDLHNGFLNAMRNEDYRLCSEIAKHLMGKFGGELDTFYEEILKRLSPK